MTHNNSNPPLARSLVLAGLAAALAVGLCGCGPSSGGYSFEPRHTTKVKTVAVPIFQRDAGVFRRDLETRLTEAVIKRIELDTPYKVASRETADSILEGRLVRIDQRVLSYGPDSKLPRQTEVTFTVAFTWKDLRSGEILAKKGNLRYSGVYTGDGRDEFATGAVSAIDRTALAIVQAMEEPW